MYFVESSILLDANVFDERQENTKPIVTRFVVPWIFEILFLFTLLYILGVKKHALFNKFLSQ